jgi:hypothetical protein
MNVYFLVEGKRTERKVYPAWLGHLLPELRRVERLRDAVENNYYLISAEGYPSILQEHLPNALNDVNNVDRYTHLVVCLDAEELAVAERRREVFDCVTRFRGGLARAELSVIVQNRCIETWFLGNRKVVSRTPQSEVLRRYLAFFDIRKEDPEQMGVFKGFVSHASFHGKFLEEVFAERGIRYSKTRPGHVMDAAYLDELLYRVRGQPRDLPTFQQFLELCTLLRSKLWSA